MTHFGLEEHTDTVTTIGPGDSELLDGVEMVDQAQVEEAYAEVYTAGDGRSVLRGHVVIVCYSICTTVRGS
jgi:hypothetical protein